MDRQMRFVFARELVANLITHAESEGETEAEAWLGGHPDYDDPLLWQGMGLLLRDHVRFYHVSPIVRIAWGPQKLWERLF